MINTDREPGSSHGSSQSSKFPLLESIMPSYSDCTASPSAFNTRAVWKVAKPTDGPKQVRSRKGAKSRSWTEKEVSLCNRGA